MAIRAAEVHRRARFLLPRGSQPRRNQGGFTLVEAIVSLALVSTVVLSLAAGLLTTVRSSASAKGTQSVDAALSAYAESFKGQIVAGGCPAPTEFEQLMSEPAWFTTAGTTVDDFGVDTSEGWNDAAGVWNDCTAASPPSSLTHRLTVRVAVDTAEGQQVSTGQVVVRQDP